MGDRDRDLLEYLSDLGPISLSTNSSMAVSVGELRLQDTKLENVIMLVLLQ